MLIGKKVFRTIWALFIRVKFLAVVPQIENNLGLNPQNGLGINPQNGLGINPQNGLGINPDVNLAGIPVPPYF